MYFTVLYFTVLYFTVLYCTVLYCTVLHSCTTNVSPSPFSCNSMRSYPSLLTSVHVFPPQHESLCTVISSSLIQCTSPAVGPEARRARVRVHFLLDSLQFEFSSVSGGGVSGGGEAFSYQPDPMLFPLNRKDRSKPYHHKPGSIISVEVRRRPCASVMLA